MTATAAIACTALVILLAAPCQAQYLAPTAVRHLDVPAEVPLVFSAVVRGDTVERWGRINTTGGIIGGVIGAAGGSVLGATIGVSSARNCKGEECGLASALLGFAIGESVGLGLGTHFGSGGNGDAILTTFTSFVTLVGGGLMATAASSSGAPRILFVAVPALQITAALAVERAAMPSPR